MERSNLPVQLTSFIGRQREQEDIEEKISTSRLVTLTGPGGCGKTRLAIQVASKVKETYANGACLVDLAPLQESILVPQSVARALGVRRMADKSLLDELLSWVENRELLLILDNCEHLSSTCAKLVSQLLSRSPDLRVLATSREALALPGETIYQVAGMAYPYAHPESLPNILTDQLLDDYMQYDAVRLFVERAQAIVPGFHLTTENTEPIAEICRKLDGIPLALELAGARVNVLTVQQIARRLDDRFSLLITPKYSEVTPRHRTLRAAIDWSYDLLSESEQMMLRRLSVFAGGCSLGMAEIVCTGDGIARDQVIDLISSLVEKSLVMAETLQRKEARYTLLETIRKYGHEKLADSGEGQSLRDRHLWCFLDLTEETDSKLRGKYQLLWLNRLDDEYDNIRVALAWSLKGGRQESKRVSAGLRIATSLYQFWRIRDYVEEGLNWSKQLADAAGDEISPIVRANALSYASLLAGVRGSAEEQKRFGDEAVTLGEAAGVEGKRALALALGAQGYAARVANDQQAAATLARRQIQLYRDLGDRYLLGVSLSLFSSAAMSLGEYDEAHAMLNEGLVLLRETGDTYRIAVALNYSGDLARCERNYAQAQQFYVDSISLFRGIDAVRDLASVLHNLGHACLHVGDIEQAQELFNESMEVHQDQGNRLGMAECLLGYAALAITTDRPDASAQLLAAAVAHGGEHITSEWAATRLEYEQYLEQARTRLGEAAFRAQCETGQRLSLEEAVVYAREMTRSVTKAQRTHNQLDELTPREREVAALIGRARSNGEIAEELVVSKRTIESHIASIRSKLMFTERAQIIRWAIETGLVDFSE